jgi:hypothetical protein
LIQQLLRREWTGWKLFTGRDVVHWSSGKSL